MAEVLLVSETFVKEVCSISDNVAGQYIRPSIREAQDVSLRNILGDLLLDRLKALVASGEIGQEVNVWYKTLADRERDFLANSACVGIAQRVAFKIANAGVVKTPDEKVDVADQPDMAKVQFFYQSKADSMAFDLERWLLENRTHFPELLEYQLRKIHSHLYTAASCGIWLGGPRGRHLPGTPIFDRDYERRVEELL